MLTYLLVLAATAALAPAIIALMGLAGFAVLAVVPAVGFGWILSLFLRGAFNDGAALTYHVPWMPHAHLDIDLRLDSLAALFSLIILGVGALVLLYCWGYFEQSSPRLYKFAGEMTSFAAAMFALVISDNFLLMYVFWEITSVLSFMLVGYYSERISARRSAGRALMVTTFGGLAMLVGIIMLGTDTGSWTMSSISRIDDIASTPHALIAVALILAGALSKSAIAPMHFWLPGAMAAPTPVSAYLHSAAMVKAGIYLIARLAPAAHTIPGWHLIVTPMGIFTMLLGGWMALKQIDLKLILAYGTVSQLGFIVSVMAIGSRPALQAGLALTFAHALFKAPLFMVAGAIDHTAGTRCITELSGLGRKAPLLATLATICALSMAGVPPLLGFVSKEAALTAVLEEPLLVGMPRNLMAVGLVLGSILTMAYALYFLHGAFATKDGESPAVAKMHRPGPALVASPLVLTAGTVLLGLWPHPLGAAIDVHLNNVVPEKHSEHLALWHGFGVPLLLTAVIIACGILMFVFRRLLKPLQEASPALGDANAAYDWLVDLLRKASLRLTAQTQRGSLKINAAVIFGVLVLLPSVGLLLGDRNDVHMRLWDSPWQAVAAVVIIAAAIGVTFMRNRMSAVVLVGVTGYCMAFLFSIHGAPDLALTQVLVETIIMVVFMLILRKLPTESDLSKNGQTNRLRAWLSVAVGLSATVTTMFAINARRERSIALDMPRLGEEFGHGRNTVNVLLVDIRAFDTLGEISVLVIAATGVASLIYRTQKFGRDSKRPVLNSYQHRWLTSSMTRRAGQGRAIMVEVATRILFPSMIALSLYFFFSGHNAPGGGFAGGLVAALALCLRYLAGGRAELEAALPVDAAKILGTGLVISATTAVVSLFFGYPPLTTTYWTLNHVPLIGHVGIASAMFFDAGVFLIVIGLTKHILDSMGARLDLDEERRREAAREKAQGMVRKANERRQKQQRISAGKEA